jgi:hypothetical protein
MFDARRPKGRLFYLMMAVVTAIGLRGSSFRLPALSHYLASTARLLRPAQRGMPLDNSTSCDNYPTSSLQPSNVFFTSAMN